MTWFALIFYVLIGALAGFLGGLLGIGGGLVAVPSLALTFWMLNFPSATVMHLAVGTSLGAMVFTAAASAYAHYLKNGIQWHYFRALSPGIIVGAIVSALIAGNLSNRALELFFGVSACLIGLYYCFSPPRPEEGHMKAPHFAGLVAIGVVIGAISTILGIGGGIVTVPILMEFRMPMKNAIATSAATGFLIAITGAFSFLLIGIHETVVEGSVGYLYLPAFFLIGMAALLTAPMGARFAYTLPTSMLRSIFGVCLLTTGLAMVF